MMLFRWRTVHRRTVAAAVAGTTALAALASVPLSSSAAPSLSQLNSQLGQQQARQQHLESSLSGLSQLVDSLSAQISLVQSREAAVRAELARDETNLANAQVALDREKTVLGVLRARLARARMLLAHQLVSSYESGNPDLVSVVLEANGFTDLLERVTYLRDAEHQQQAVIAVTRAAKAQADAASRRLTRLKAIDQRITDD